MDFSLSDNQLALKASVIKFANQELNRNLLQREKTREFPLEAWRACARFGIQGLPIPSAFGGAEADILTTVVAMEGLGYGCRDNGLIFSLNAQMWSLELPLLKFGTSAQ